MAEKKISIGLFGFGCVGQGLYDVLKNSDGLQASIEKICVKNPGKERKINLSFFTFNGNDILKEKKYNTVVELIDNSQQAFDIVKEVLQRKADVVTANKKMLAENFEALYQLQEENNAALLYEASAGGSIPIIRTLEEYYDNELLSSIRGILNGTCNYILTRMEAESKEYAEVLKDAQLQGFAESDPRLDVAGFDTLYKLIVLTIHSFGIILKPEQVLNLGIQNISYDDMLYAGEKGLRIKMVAVAYKSSDKLRVYAMPHFIEKKDELYNVMYEYNGIEVEGAFSCRQTFIGKGAGSHPTGSAVLSDISALRYNYRYGYKKLKKIKQALKGTYNAENFIDNDFSIKVYIRFSDKKELINLQVESIEEEYKSAKTNYIIANVKLKSLFAIKNNRESKLFVCAIGGIYNGGN